MPGELIFAGFPFFLEHEARRLSRVSKELGATSLDLPVSRLCISLVFVGYIQYRLTRETEQAVQYGKEMQWDAGLL